LKERYNQMRFMAGLQGVNLDDEVRKRGGDPGELGAPKDTTLFQDPKEYEKMSTEERQRLTEKMMGVHRQRMMQTPLGRSH
jgi:hypothetical protein